MEGAGTGGSELPAVSSDIVGLLVLAVRKVMAEEMMPKIDSILKHVEECKLARAYIEQEWKLRETRINQVENRLNQFVETGISTENKRMLWDPIPTPGRKNMELRFSKRICQPILTGDEIKAEDNTCIEVSLHDSSTGNIVDVGPVASASVELSVLGKGTGDWTGEEFNEKIVRVGEKPPLLTVTECKLQGGKCVLEKVKLRHHAAELVKPSEFRLGARIAEKFDGITVKEAKTESFVVKIYRYKYSQKNEIPCLKDNIWVLKNIQRRGNIDKRLQDKGINTVEKFLNQLLINPEGLKNIVGSGEMKWKATVKHARKCKSSRMYCYTNPQGTSHVVFDIFGRLQGLHSEGHYTNTNMLSKNKKVDADKLSESAFEHWEDVTSFDDLESLHQHLTAIKTSFYSSSPSVPGQYSGRTPDAGRGSFGICKGGIPNSDTDMLAGRDTRSEMVDESIGGIPNSDTDMLAGRDSFGICNRGFPNDFRSPIDQSSSLDQGLMSTGSGIGRGVSIARIGRSRSVSAESEAVSPGSEPPRKLKMLFFCVSRWFLIRELLNSEANPAQKKRRICSPNTGHPLSNPNAIASEMIGESNRFEFPNPRFHQEILRSTTTAFAHYDQFSVDNAEFTDFTDLENLWNWKYAS